MKNSIKNTILILVGICISIIIISPNNSLPNKRDITKQDFSKETADEHLKHQRGAYIVPGYHLIFTKLIDN